jgi:hypothetical protein
MSRVKSVIIKDKHILTKQTHFQNYDHETSVKKKLINRVGSDNLYTSNEINTW